MPLLSTGRPGPTQDEQEVNRKKLTVYPEKLVAKTKNPPESFPGVLWLISCKWAIFRKFLSKNNTVTWMLNPKYLFQVSYIIIRHQQKLLNYYFYFFMKRGP